MFLMRIELPGGSGALGTVATALGEFGADIKMLEVVERGAGFDVDDVVLDVASTLPAAVLAACCDALEGVRVRWIRSYPHGGGIERDVELGQKMRAEPARSAEIFVSAAPMVFGAQWCALIEVSVSPRVILATTEAFQLHLYQLEQLRPFDRTHRATLDGQCPKDRSRQHALVAPLDCRHAVIVGRPTDQPFLYSEQIRIHHLVAGYAEPNDASGSVSTVYNH